ncbi:MAG: AMP-binding protein [Actinomycetota bacterium]|jgi:O-succinylbenzoic acid--CoA ligase|nr:AMP-binding protein [Actinomycetota bacterium]
MPADPPRLIAVQLPPGASQAAAITAVWDAGDAVLPLDPQLSEQSRDAVLAALRPEHLLDDRGLRDLPAPARTEAGVAAVILTSGSTGAPKAVELTSAALDASAAASLARIDAVPDDRWLCCLPLHHIAGLQVLVRARRARSAAVVHPGFDVAAVAAEPAVTMVSLVPTMLQRLLDAGADVSRFRRVLLGGAAPAPDLLARARRAGARIVVTYGMTETGGGCVYDGRPLDGVEVAVDADGRIRLRGPVLFRGYRGEPAATNQALRDGWLGTADLGRLTADGGLQVLGRADDVIITGGENVRAGEIAAALAEHPAIDEAAVVGRPDPEWGQRVVAFVVAPGVAPALDEVRTFVRARLSGAHAPRELVVVDRLPRLASGKVDRLALHRLPSSPPPRPA